MLIATFSRCRTLVNAMLVNWADSIGRRNMVFLGLPQAFVKRLGGRFPPERFSRAAVERGHYGGKVVGCVRTEIGTFGKLLPQQAIGVLVGAALPRTVRIAEGDRDAGVDLETRMRRHLGPLIPRRRSAQFIGQGDDGARNGIANCFDTVACHRRSILYRRRACMPGHPRKVKQHCKACRAFDEGANR